MNTILFIDSDHPDASPGLQTKSVFTEGHKLLNAALFFLLYMHL